jgi:hypothetical protein
VITTFAAVPDFSIYISAAIGALVVGAGIWVQQRSHEVDRGDAKTLRDTAAQVGEIQTVLEAWKSIVQANAETIKMQAAELAVLRAKLEERDEENLQLKAEVASLRQRIAILEREVRKAS